MSDITTSVPAAYGLFLSALTAAAFTVQEEAVKTDGDTEEEEDEEDVRQAAEDEQSEEAETEETCECHTSGSGEQDEIMNHEHEANNAISDRKLHLKQADGGWHL